MLKVVCPNCQYSASLSRPKTGKFAPTCRRCKTKFRLRIKQLPDGSFSSRVAKIALDNPRQTKKQSVPLGSSKTFSEVNLQQATTRAQTQVDMTSAAINTNSEAVVSGVNAPGPGQLAIGTNLGPYRLVKLLGQGGMGSVYLARQASLDRDVALKVINTRLSNSPRALSRFTREAYAAAQLVHPNVVQVYDMGDDRGYCYFSMELVAGRSLADWVASEKKLAPKQAASFMLHAARGLAHAHAAGMVHRDIKPGNLLVDASGTVKVADLGLVKVPDQEEIDHLSDFAEGTALTASEDLTRLGSTIGTPDFMAPEQATNSMEVDHRADIYSLGCTFYVLLTGKKPFESKTFEKMVSKRSSASSIQINPGVVGLPTSLSGIVSKMMAKKPADRYQSMNEVITELESFLGLAVDTNFTPDEPTVTLLEKNAQEFNEVNLAPFRSLFPIALVSGCLFLALMTSYLSWRWASSFLMLPFFAIGAYGLVSGLRENGPLFLKAREFVFERGVFSGLKWLMGGAVVILVVYSMGLWVPWLIMTFLGIGLAVCYCFFVDQRIADARRVPLAAIEQLLKTMRSQGLDERTVLRFVAQYSGRHWEELFELLFGYEAKRRMREDLAQSAMAQSAIAQTRPKFRGWRDRFYDEWNHQLRQLKLNRNRQYLENVEFASLQAEGLPPAEARERANQMAGALVDQAANQKIAAVEQRIAELDPSLRSVQKRQKIKQLLADARSGKYRQEKSRLQLLEPVLNRYLGSYTRFLLGAVLIVGWVFWAIQNGILFAAQDAEFKVHQAIPQTEQDTNLLQEPTLEKSHPDQAPLGQTAEPDSPSSVESQAKTALADTLHRETRPLNVPVVGRLFDSFNSLVAGLILVTSALVFGWKMTLFAIPAAFVAMFGGMFVNDIESFPTIHSLSSAIAGVIFMLGVVFGRAED